MIASFFLFADGVVVTLVSNTTSSWICTEIEVDGEIETIKSTAEHPYFILNASSDRQVITFEGCEQKEAEPIGLWIAAKDLKVGDKVLLSNGKNGIICKLDVEHLAEPETTYNFEVAEFHTYYVGKQSVLVHNACPVTETEIIGKAHGSPQHQAEINRITGEMANSGDYSKIYLNRSLSTTGVKAGSQLRPDIIGVRRIGGFDLVEVASRTQASGRALEALQRNIGFFEKLSNVNNVRFIPWGY